MIIKNCLPLCFSVAVSLGGCGAAEPGPAGPAGPTGQTGPVDPNLTSLLPSGAFLSRTLELQIAGSGTHFTSASTVDFGDPQVTASAIAAGGDNNLRVTVQVGASAQLGPHDVTVTSGSESATLKAAFTVKVALQAEPVGQAPSVPQGGLYVYNLRNLDYHDNPFSAGTPTLSGMSAVSTNAQPARINGVALIDALTPAGILSISANSPSPFGADILYTTAQMDSSLARASARTPNTLTNNTARTGDSLLNQYASNFYKLTTVAANQLVILTYSGLGTALNGGAIKLVTAVAPPSGKFSQGTRAPWTFDSTAQTGLVLTELAAAGDYYVATFTDNYSGAATGYTYTITPKVNTLTSMNNPEPVSETPANPSLRINSLTGAVKAGDGKLTTSADKDYVLFTAASTGNVLFQMTNTSPSGSEQVGVQLYSDAACTTMLGIPEAASPGESVTKQIAVTSGMTYCAGFGMPLPSTAEAPYKILLAP